MRTSIKLMGLSLVLSSATAMAANDMTHHSSSSLPSLSSSSANSSARSYAASLVTSSAHSLSVSSVMKGRVTKDADNTDINTRDKGGNTLTAQQQSNSQSDLKLLAAVRSAIVDAENLSMAAHNVKIMAVNGVVTLRGPVKSMDEKKRVEKLARAVAGVRRIDNQLDIDTN